MTRAGPMPSKGWSRRTFIGRSAAAVATMAATSAVAACRTSSSSTNPAPRTGSDSTATLGLGITGLIVRDLQRSLAFYRRLGIPIPDQVRGDNFRMKLATGQIFFWDTETLTRSYDPGWKPSTGSRRVVLEFGFATRPAVDAKYTEMVGAGYQSYLTASVTCSDPATRSSSTPTATRSRFATRSPPEGPRR